MGEFHSAAEVSSLPPGHGRTVHVKGREFALFNVDGQYCAVDNLCPHRGGPLGAGTCEKDHVFCPLHGWEFDLKTGECLSNPAKPVKKYATRVDNGQVYIEI